jgi:hypothetical protein
MIEVLLFLSILAFLALVWAGIAILQHIYVARRRYRALNAAKSAASSSTES